MDLIDILWRQDVDLGVEREIFDGCLRQREEESVRERELKREQELERIRQRLQKLDKETGEVLPSPSHANSQAVSFSEMLPSSVLTEHSPVTQNPLLSALLFSKKSQKPPPQEQNFLELATLPDLQFYLDVLESESSRLPLEDICQHSLSAPRQMEQTTDVFNCISDLMHTISESFQVAQPLSEMGSDPGEILGTCTQSVPETSTQTLPPSNPVYTSKTRIESQDISPRCQGENAAPSEFCTDLKPMETEPFNYVTERDLSPFDDHRVLQGFDDSASVASVDLDTSLYTVDSLSNSQSDMDELESIQSDYIDMLSMELYGTVTSSQEPQTQNESTLNHCNQFNRVRRTSRDEQRARALSLPISMHDIINLPVDAFNEALSSCKLNEAQHTLIRDIRRRGKNKMAAQSCRKRKMDSLVGLEDEIEALKREKHDCKEEKEKNTRKLFEMKEKLKKLYSEVFRRLRDERGSSYSPKEYKLQLSTDGTVFLLPRSTNRNIPPEDLATTS
ncbi:hypothetical protein DNTS_009249 [Danionella cerebrum]|uniref:BZIP domain-containing protein n=1 Tax=Danionella cerebrum TaxID=2873325 RepID=A0A553Q5K3_9TELE|nr:hypothetical protein DNTS_009249 [Danionella translucida]